MTYNYEGDVAGPRLRSWPARTAFLNLPVLKSRKFKSITLKQTNRDQVQIKELKDRFTPRLPKKLRTNNLTNDEALLKVHLQI